MEALLFRDFAPVTAGMIGGMAQSGSYNGQKFHRVISGFMMQGGDFAASGTIPLGAGNPGFQFRNEFDPALIFSGSGQLAMANAGFDGAYNATNGSQFFITFTQTRFLDFNHTIFGQLVRGFDVLAQAGGVETDSSDAPVEDVEMEDVSLVPNNHDAVLLLTATGTGSAVVTFSVTDASGATQTASIIVTGTDDTTNDPPILQPIADRIVGQGKATKIPLVTTDLEGDAISTVGDSLDGLAGGSLSLTMLSASAAYPTYSGSAALVIGVGQDDASSRGSSSFLYDVQTFLLGFGAKKMTVTPSAIKVADETPFNRVLATVVDADKTTTPGNITATINWGDGSPLATGSNVIVTQGDVNTLHRFLISGTHQYAEPGTYHVPVVIRGKNGVRVSATTTIVVTDDDIAAWGVDIKAAGGNAKNKIVATFTDDAPLSSGTGYTARIDWGDGTSSPGVVSPAKTGGFTVKGTKPGKYPGSGNYSVCVKVARPGTEAVAWSRAVVSGIKTRVLPPFPMANLTLISGSFSKQSAVVTGGTNFFVSGYFQLRNSGAAKLGGAAVEFYLSNDTTLDESDTMLSCVNGVPWLGLPAFKANSAAVTVLLSGSGRSDYRLQLPLNVNPSGKYLLVYFYYTDPLTDHQSVPRIFSYKL
jgi:cyclophilin family peptidyl-prolyl cis-trans isomerase